MTPRLAHQAALALLILTLCASAIAAQPLGATPNPDGSTTFRVWAPNADVVEVAGSFNGWNRVAMFSEGASGIWNLTVANTGIGDEYKFILDDDWRVDPRARNTVHSNGNGIIEDDGSAYQWQATDWQTPLHEEMIIYELHVGSFSGNGDGVTNSPGTFRDVVDAHLGDLVDLGVNMVKIMPIHEFPGDRSWGYNPVHLFAPESNYGSPDDLRYMVDTLHENGIGVILDVVYNHFSPSDNNLWDFDGPENIYYFGNNCSGETPWGSTRPRYTEEQVRSFIIDNARFWIEEYRIDGLRLDATQYMRGYCTDMGEGWLLMGDVADAVHAANPRAIIIAEELPNTDLVTTPRNEGGAGYDAQWADYFGDVMRAEIPAADPNVGEIASAMANSGFGRGNNEAVKYVDSHDEAGNLNGGSRINARVDSENPFGPRARGLAMVAGGINLVTPGIPMLLQGQEFLENKPFGDGEGDRIWWGFLSNGQGPTRDFFSVVCGLRTDRGSLHSDESIQFIQINEGANVLAFQRWDSQGDVTFVIANLSGTDFATYNVGVPSGGEWHELVNSQTAAFGGTASGNGTETAINEARDGMPAQIAINLPAYSFLVFSQTPLETAPGIAHGFSLR